MTLLHVSTSKVNRGSCLSLHGAPLRFGSIAQLPRRIGLCVSEHWPHCISDIQQPLHVLRLESGIKVSPLKVTDCIAQCPTRVSQAAVTGLRLC